MRLTPVFALLCFAPLVATAEGEIYRWKDNAGIWHYSDQPQPGAELVSTGRRPVSSPSTPAPRTADAPPPAIPPVSSSVADQVRAEAEAARAEQCRKATENYDKAIQARRMYRTDEQGNQVFLNDAELDQARLEARSARDVACGQQ